MERFKENFQARFSSRPGKSLWKQAASLAGVAIAYWAAVRLGLIFVAHPENVASIWPASGLALAVLLLNPKDQWFKLLAVIFVTNALGNLSGDNSLLVSLGFALANTLESLIGAWALIQFCKSKITFGRTVEVTALFGVATLCNGITALLGAAVPALAFGAPFFDTWWVWWAADGLGIILVTPFIVVWVTSQNLFRSIPPRRLVEGGLLTLALAVFAWLLFGPFTKAEDPGLRSYMVFPVLILLAFRYKLRGLTGILALVAAIAIWNTLQGYGVFAFANQDTTERIISVQMFLSVISFSGLFLSTVITELKKTDESLREGEGRWRALIQNLPSFVAEASPDGVILTLNRTQPGFSLEAYVGKSLFDVVALDSREQFKEAFAQALKTVKMVEYEAPGYGANREPAWYSRQLVPIVHEGQIRSVLMVANDISERKQAEEYTHRMNERFMLATRAASMGLWDWDIQKNELTWDERMYELYGMNKSDAPMPYEVWLNELHPDDMARSNLESEQAQRGEKEYNTEFRVVWPDSTIHHIKAYGQVTWDTNGVPLRMTGINFDITQQKQAEEALRKNEEQYRSLFDNMTEGFAFHELIFDENGEPYDYRFLDVNHAFEQLTGLKREDIIGRGQRDVLPEEDPFWFRMYSRVALSGESMHLEHYSPPLQRYYEVYAYCPAPKQFAVVFTDITERKKAEEEIHQLNASLEQRVEERTRELRETQEQLVRQEKLAVLGQMAGSVSHELRNPLGVISNAIYFLKLVQPDANDKVKEYLDLIEKNLNLSNKIVTDLLDFTRVKTVERETVSVSELIRQTLERFPPPESVKVELNIPTDAPQIYADQHHIVQILGNLTLNACQAMMSQGGTLTISSRIQDEMVEVSVQDTGSGISPENLKNLFEPLFTTKPKGIGLGLAVSKKLIEANEGRIEVQSEEGIGSTFTIRLPIGRSAS